MKLASLVALGLILCRIQPVFAGPLAETLLTLEPTADYPRHSEGAVVEFTDGRTGLIYSRFTGGSRDESAADLVLLTTEGLGKPWSDPRVLVPQGAADNVMSVSVIRGSNGDWLLFHIVRHGWNDCHLVVRRTADEFHTLGEPVRVTQPDGYHVVNNDRVVRLSTGRLIVPSALHPCEDGTWQTWSPDAVCMAHVSDDDGRTWRRCSGPVPAPANEKIIVQEPGIIELSDGRLMMWMRSSGKAQYQSFSNDGGEHWSMPEPGPLVSARLSPASIRRIPRTDALLAVWNDPRAVTDDPPAVTNDPRDDGVRMQLEQDAKPASGPASMTRPVDARTPLVLAISRDDGRTWSKPHTIESALNGWYCYTSIAFIEDRVVLSYCAGDSKVGKLNRLKVVSMRLHDVTGFR